MLCSAQEERAQIFSLAAGVPVNGEKPHQGAASKNRTLHQGQIACNSTAALGLSWHWRAETAPGAGVTYDYDAWGNIVNQTGSTPNVYRYRGEQYDPDLNLYYLRARYFNPVTGRFLTRDPATGKITDPKSLHKYLYAGANPVDATDPSGRATFSEWALIVAMISILVLGPMVAASCEIRRTGWAILRRFMPGLYPKETGDPCEDDSHTDPPEPAPHRAPPLVPVPMPVGR